MTDSLERLSSALSDRYRIEREIGSGGMATVYLAQDIKHQTGTSPSRVFPSPSFCRSGYGAEQCPERG
jgi:serine/threonine protein kinase